MTLAFRRPASWIPWIYAGGMLLVVAVNAVLITVALRSFPGLVVQRPYDRGIAYNDEIRQNQSQAALGWTVVPRYADGRLAVRIADADGAPIAGLAVRATILRPLGGLAPTAVELAPRDDAYVADVGPLSAGQWEVRIGASGPPGDYRIAYRIVVP
jgi:nitrogen fixation protein FixH